MYVNTKPASNMPKRALAYVLTNKNVEVGGKNYSTWIPNLGYGVHKNLMVHAAPVFVTGPDGFDTRGATGFAQYRLFTRDKVNFHDRGAVYLQLGYTSDTPAPGPIDFAGDHGGVQLGTTLTRLIRRTAVSVSGSWGKVADTSSGVDLAEGNVWNGSLAVGYLFLPRVYKSYQQTNVNLYVELLAQTTDDLSVDGNMFQASGSFIDVAPSLQFILRSTTRLEFSYRTELSGDMERWYRSQFLVRLQHNVFR